MRRRWILVLTGFVFGVVVAGFTQEVPAEDKVRIAEFYRLAASIDDQIWPGWSKVPDPLLLVTAESEFLTHHPSPPAEFKAAGDGFFVRPRQFPVQLEATFPVFGPPAVIVIGEPKSTAAKTSTPWVIVVMHEHFHQLQDAQPGYFQAVDGLGLSHGDESGMWMLEYPFPYKKPEVVQSFGRLRDLLLAAVTETDPVRFRKDAEEYVAARRKFFAQLSADDHKYLSFQLWQEGMARYTQVMAAEAAAKYQPTAAFAGLADYEPFSAYGARARVETLEELKKVDLAKSQRGAIYPFGAAEGMLLDRINPGWKDEYFKHLLSTDDLFEVK
jgi:hypothetical protein